MLQHPVFQALLPVILLIAVGYAAGRMRLIGAESKRDLTNLVFLVLLPAMLFRAMAGVHLENLALRPIALYFAGCFVVFFGMLLVKGWTREGAVVGLAAMFSNTAMLGLPIARLAYGEEALRMLVTLVSMHALVLLTVVTLTLELAVLREQRNTAGSPAGRGIVRTVLLAVRNAVLHPVPLPILAGLLYAQTGFPLPAVLDTTLQLLGSGFAPVALVMVGITLAHSRVQGLWVPALRIALLKNVIHPLVVVGVCWLGGLRGLPLVVMGVAAAMPTGANVFLFAQRYRVAEPLMVASVGVSTGLGLFTVAAAMALLDLLPR